MSNSNALVNFSECVTALTPRYDEALDGAFSGSRLVQTAIFSVKNNPSLLECTQHSLLASVMSAAVLGLEIDGVTGQAFIIPFKNKAQLVIGYKGYNTLGFRAGFTITGEAVFDGDDFDYDTGTSPFVKHHQNFKTHKLEYAWAAATAKDHTPVISILPESEIETVRRRSPGAKRKDSPWNDQLIGYPAMAAKTAKRRLCRSMPLCRMQLAARMEEALDEEGRGGYIDENQNLVIDQKEPDFEEVSADKTPDVAELTKPIEQEDGLEYLRNKGMKAAGKGTNNLRVWFDGLANAEKVAIKPYLDDYLKPIAAKMGSAPATITTAAEAAQKEPAAKPSEASTERPHEEVKNDTADTRAPTDEAAEATEEETDELATEYLPAQVEFAQSCQTLDDLEAVNEGVRGTLDAQDRTDLVGIWNSTYLECKLKFEKSKKKAPAKASERPTKKTKAYQPDSEF